MIGVQVDKDPVAIEKSCLEKGLLFSTAGTNTLRFVPPLNISKKEIDQGLEILKPVLEKYFVVAFISFVISIVSSSPIFNMAISFEVIFLKALDFTSL